MDPVGRDTELAALRAALDDVSTGVGRVVLISGDPGIGKSTVVDAFRPDALAAGATWLWGAAWEDLGAPAYWPWIQVLRTATRISPAAAAREADLGPLGPATPSVSPPEQFALYDAVADLLAAMSRQAPVVVVLEDLHAAGVATARLLEFVARFDRNVPVLLIGTYRSAEVAADPELQTILARLEDSATALTPPPLAEHEIARILVAGGVTAEPGLVREVAERTQGNPLFVAHIARRLAAGGTTADAGLPLGLRNALRRRAERVTAGTNVPDVPEVLDAAAVLGVDLDTDVLAGVLDATPLQVRAVLDAAVAAGLLRAGRVEPHRYEFAHAVVREALHDGITAARRAELHLRTGHALAAAGGGPARLAHHFSAAWPAGGAAEAAEQCRLAGETATAAHAHAEAVASFRDALTALGRMPAAEPRERCALLIALAAARFRAGRTAEGQNTARLALDVAQTIADVEMVGRAALLVVSNLPFNAVDHNAIAILRGAEEYWAGRASATRAVLLSRLAGLTAPVDLVDASAIAARAEEVAASLGSEVSRRERSAALTAALNAQLEVAWGRHDPSDARVIARRLVDIADEPAAEAAAAIWDAVFSLELGETSAAEDAVRSLEHLAARERQPALRHLALSRRAALTILLGDFERGVRLVHEARAVAADADLPDGDAVSWGQLFAVWKLAGLDEADADLMERIATELAENSPYAAAHAAAVVLMRVARGDVTGGRQLFVHTMLSLDSLPHDLLWPWTITLLGEGAVALGDHDAGLVLYDRLLSFADRFVVAAGAVVCIGSASQQLGKLARLLGRDETARQHFSAALRAHQEAGCAALAAASERALAELTPAAAAFEADGQVITVRYAQEVARLPVTLGLRYLALLAASPGTDIEATRLVALGSAGSTSGQGGDAPENPVLSADVLLDKTALTSYRSRLADLDAELDEAAAWNDHGRTAKLEEERDFLLAELSRSVGLGGRPRRFTDEFERARVNVTRAIRSAIRRIDAQTPALSAHLDRCVTTGGRCRYDPTAD